MLTALHDAIVAGLAADLPTLGTCDAYPEVQKTLALPAVLIECEELLPADLGSGKLDITARFIAYCIYDPNAANAELEVVNLAATVAVRVFQRANFGLAIKAAQIARAGKDDMRPELDGYLVWAVEWSHDLSLGEDYWQGQPVVGPATTVTIGSFKMYEASHSMADGVQEPAAIDNISLEGG